MPIEIVPHSPALREAVEAFNTRMREGGSRWGFYAEHECTWLPKRSPEQRVWREFHLAVEDGGLVRGGFALKPQAWLIHGQPQIVADWQGPFSEGAISAKFGALGLRMVREMLKRRPLLFSWGHGGNEQPIVQMLRKLDWLMHETPFCLKVLSPARFLRKNAYLRTTPARRLALDALAFSGAGSIGIPLLHAALGVRSLFRSRAQAQTVETFGPFADELWERCKHAYAAIAVRDAASMNLLTPAGGWPKCVRVRVDRGGTCIGWALVMDTQMQDDARFGSLRVGSIVDCLALPEDAPDVVAAATRLLSQRGVDVIMSNQAHPAWVEGFAACGYVVLPKKRIFAASPQLKAALEPLERGLSGLHLTNMDGHGPMLL